MSEPSIEKIAQELPAIIVSSLQLDRNPEEINEATKLFDDGLDLDSIDVLELSVEISKKYGIEFTKEESKDSWVDIKSLAKFISEKISK